MYITLLYRCPYVILDPADHIRVPPPCRRADNWDGHIGAQQLGVGFADGERVRVPHHTGIILHIILQRAQDDLAINGGHRSSVPSPGPGGQCCSA